MRRFAFIALVACGVLAGGILWGSLYPRMQQPPTGFTFLAYGDCRRHPEVHARVLESMIKTNAPTVVVTGDLVNQGDVEEQWIAFRESTRELRRRTTYFSAKGDHDGSDQRFFEKEMNLDRPYFSRVLGDVHFFVLDSTSNFSDPDQLEWFKREVTASRSPHRIAVFHNPPFSLFVNEDRLKQCEEIRTKIHSELVNLKICGVICGHMHAFYTLVRDGLRYVITGGGGSNRQRYNTSLLTAGDLFREVDHFIGFRVQAKRITAEVIDQYGAVANDLAFTLCEHLD